MAPLFSSDLAPAGVVAVVVQHSELAPPLLACVATRRAVAGWMGCPGGLLATSGIPPLWVGAGMGPRRVELFAAIRYDWQRNQMPVRALARKYDVHRRTVRQAIASPVPPDRKVPVRAAPVREAVAGWIDEMLREDLGAPRKQRHTARRVFERLRDEHDAQVSYSTVAKYVQQRRGVIAAGARAGPEGAEGFVPQAKA